MRSCLTMVFSTIISLDSSNAKFPILQKSFIYKYLKFQPTLSWGFLAIRNLGSLIWTRSPIERIWSEFSSSGRLDQVTYKVCFTTELNQEIDANFSHSIFIIANFNSSLEILLKWYFLVLQFYFNFCNTFVFFV